MDKEEALKVLKSFIGSLPFVIDLPDQDEMHRIRNALYVARDALEDEIEYEKLLV